MEVGRYNLKSTYMGQLFRHAFPIAKSLAHFPPSCGTKKPRYFSFSAIIGRSGGFGAFKNQAFVMLNVEKSSC